MTALTCVLAGAALLVSVLGGHNRSTTHDVGIAILVRFLGVTEIPRVGGRRVTLGIRHLDDGVLLEGTQVSSPTRVVVLLHR